MVLLALLRRGNLLLVVVVFLALLRLRNLLVVLLVLLALLRQGNLLLVVLVLLALLQRGNLLLVVLLVLLALLQRGNLLLVVLAVLLALLRRSLRTPGSPWLGHCRLSQHRRPVVIVLVFLLALRVVQLVLQLHLIMPADGLLSRSPSHSPIDLKSLAETEIRHPKQP